MSKPADSFAIENLRVISLAPIITEIIVELGFENSIVGKTKYCVTKNNKNIRVLGSYLDPNIESILSLKPDYLILMTGQESVKKKLERFKLKVILISNGSIEEVNFATLKIAEIFNATQTADELIRLKKDEIKSIALRCKHQNLKSLFIFDEGEFGPRKVFYAASTSSIYAEIMKTVGLENILISKKEYSELSIEGIKALNPQKLFIVSESKDANQQLETIAKLTKIKIADMVLLPNDPTMFPGPRYPQIMKLFACNHRSSMN